MDNAFRNYENTGLFDVKIFKIQEERNRIYVDSFCRKYNIELLAIGDTSENGRRELIYFFNDGLGGYTLDAIIGSLM